MSKTAIIIDATISMGNVFKRLVSVIQKALPLIRLAIQDSKVQGSFEIKWVIYRNYNSIKDELISYSNFEQKP